MATKLSQDEEDQQTPVAEPCLGEPSVPWSLCGLGLVGLSAGVLLTFWFLKHALEDKMTTFITIASLFVFVCGLCVILLNLVRLIASCCRAKSDPLYRSVTEDDVEDDPSAHVESSSAGAPTGMWMQYPGMKMQEMQQLQPTPIQRTWVPASEMHAQLQLQYGQIQAGMPLAQQLQQPAQPLPPMHMQQMQLSVNSADRMFAPLLMHPPL